MAVLPIIFRKLTIRFLTHESVEIKWEIENSPIDLSTIAFRVYRSENPINNFKQVSPDLVDIFTYRDRVDESDESKWKITYYKVQAYNLNDPTELVESPTDYVHEDPYDDGTSPFVDPVLDIVRRNDMMLEHERFRLGKPSVVYQKRSYGTICSCFDKVTHRVTKSNCPRCLGTGKIEGYHSGIENIYVNFLSLPKQKLIQTWGDAEPGDTQAWMSNFPLLKPEDIIVNSLSNEHWVVKRVRTSFHLIVSKQTLLVRLLNYDDIKTRLSFTVKKFRF